MTKHTFSVVWSEPDKEYVGLCAEYPSLSWLAKTEAEALAGIKRLVDDVIADTHTEGS